MAWSLGVPCSSRIGSSPTLLRTGPCTPNECMSSTSAWMPVSSRARVARFSFFSFLPLAGEALLVPPNLVALVVPFTIADGVGGLQPHPSLLLSCPAPASGYTPDPFPPAKLPR